MDGDPAEWEVARTSPRTCWAWVADQRGCSLGEDHDGTVVLWDPLDSVLLLPGSSWDDGRDGGSDGKPTSEWFGKSMVVREVRHARKNFRFIEAIYWTLGTAW